MTVKELIEELQKFDLNMKVVVSSSEESYEPGVYIKQFNFKTSYWDRGFNLVSIPEGEEFIEL